MSEFSWYRTFNFSNGTFNLECVGQETAEDHGGAAVHRKGVREGSGLRSRALLPRAGEGRRAPGPQGPEGDRLWESGKTARLPPASFPQRAGGLWGRTPQSGTLLLETRGSHAHFVTAPVEQRPLSVLKEYCWFFKLTCIDRRCSVRLPNNRRC